MVVSQLKRLPMHVSVDKSQYKSCMVTGLHTTTPVNRPMYHRSHKLRVVKWNSVHTDFGFCLCIATALLIGQITIMWSEFIQTRRSCRAGRSGRAKRGCSCRVGPKQLLLPSVQNVLTWNLQSMWTLIIPSCLGMITVSSGRGDAWSFRYDCMKSLCGLHVVCVTLSLCMI